MKQAKKQETAVIVKDNRTGDMGVAFLEGPAEYINEMFAKGPAKTAYGKQEAELLKGLIGGGTEQELEQTTPINEKQITQIYPYAVPAKMTDPLTRVDKTRIHDNIRRDDATKRVLLFICHFMIPEPPTLTLGLNMKKATKQREKEQLVLIQDDPDYLDMLEVLMNRDEDLDLYSRQISLVFSAHAFGRSVLVKQYDTEGYPKRLIPLASTRLGRWWVDKFTWDPLGVEYNDYAKDKRILLTKDIVHYEVDDFHVTPNSLYYGTSAVESTMAIGERNRSTNEIAMPEIMKRMFAPLMLVKVKGSKTQARLDAIRDAWKSGKTVFYNSDIEIVVVALPHDLEKLRDTVDEGGKAIFRGGTVPLGVGWQGDQNRSTFEGAMLQWYEGPLSFKRAHFANVFWRQYYKPQLELMFAQRDLEIGGAYNFLMQRATRPNQRLPFKIVMEFKNVRTTGFLDTAAALAQFGDRRYLGRDQILQEAGFAKYIEEMNEPLANSGVPTFASMDNTMNNNIIPPGADTNPTNLATQGTSNFKKGLPTGNTTAPDRTYD